MITPLDIQNKEFTKSMRGYKVEEVDMFLDLITLDLEKLVKENTKLKTELGETESELKKYKGSEGEVVKVLEQARQLMGDISQSAEKRADVILKNAEMDAELAVRESRDRAQRLMEEHKNLRSRYESFRDRYKKMLEDELAHFNNMNDNMFPDFTENKLEDILSGMDEISSPADTQVIDAVPESESGDDDRKTMVVNLKNGGGE